MSTEKNLELRSEDVQEILSKMPNWMIRWGSTVVIIILISVLFFSWIIKYPDVISTEIIITTSLPPEKSIAKVNGKIETIFVHDKMVVTKKTPLAVIENSANYKDVFLLNKILDTFDINKNNFPFNLLKSAQLGDIENSFALFYKESKAFELHKKLNHHTIEDNAQSYESIQLRDRLNITESQRTINQSELNLQKNDLERFEILYSKGIISKQEIEKHQLSFLRAEKNYKNSLNSLSHLKSSINDFNKNGKMSEIAEQREEIDLERNIFQAYNQLKVVIKEWELKYVFYASINGRVSFLQLWADNQSVTLGENVFTIIPQNKMKYIGKAKAPIKNSGKIKLGQLVNIRLTNYPDKEFGIIKGVIKSISLIADKEGNVLINVDLPKNLATSYNKQITFQQEMSGNADIITEDLRLFERLLYQFRIPVKN